METENQGTVEYTMGFGLVNLISIILVIPILAIYLWPFIVIWDYETFESGKDAFMEHVLLILLIGTIAHELLHGLTWGYYSTNGMKSIKFGIQWKILTPYCHCKEPLKVKHYKIGGAMPLIVLGIIPSVIGLIIGNGALITFGIFFTWAAGGDIISLFMLRKLDKEEYVSDHPNRMGFIRKVDLLKTTK